MFAPVSFKVVSHVYRPRPYFLSVAVNWANVGLFKATSKRLYHTSFAGVGAGNELDLTFRLETSVKQYGIQQNFIMLPDLPARKDHATRSEILRALQHLGVPNERVTLIVSSDNVKNEQGVEEFGRFLAFQGETKGAFKNVLVVKGSSGRALNLSIDDSCYTQMCRMVQDVQPGKLALVMNPYMPHMDFLAEIKRKSQFMPVKYFTQPIFNPYDLPLETRLFLERLMGTEEIKLSVGFLALERRMYLEQQMSSMSDARVHKTGRDKYILPKFKGSDDLDFDYLKKLPEWLSTHHRDPSDALYTRWGYGHDGSPILRMLEGTQFDLQSSKH
jgi:hypothetical protein